MSNKYPCVYYDNGKCQKFSDDTYTAWCDFDQCEFQSPSNGDKIRGMTDEELADFLDSVYCHGWSKGANGFSDGDPYYHDWLKQPYGGDT